MNAGIDSSEMVRKSGMFIEIAHVGHSLWFTRESMKWALIPALVPEASMFFASLQVFSMASGILYVLKVSGGFGAKCSAGVLSEAVVTGCSGMPGTGWVLWPGMLMFTAAIACSQPTDNSSVQTFHTSLPLRYKRHGNPQWILSMLTPDPTEEPMSETK